MFLSYVDLLEGFSEVIDYQCKTSMPQIVSLASSRALHAVETVAPTSILLIRARRI